MLDNCDLSGHFSKLSGNPAYRHSLQEVVGGCISCEGVHEDLAQQRVVPVVNGSVMVSVVMVMVMVVVVPLPKGAVNVLYVVS